MKTQVAIVGAGPTGTLLSLLLHQAGVSSVVLERSTREHVLSRIRAGVLESGTVRTLRDAGLAKRLDDEGIVHDTINIAWGGDHQLSINVAELVGESLVAYGQSAIQEDLYDAAEREGLDLRFEVSDVVIHDADSSQPSVTYVHEGATERIEADFVVGCDGFRGVSRTTIPDDVRREYEKTYPFGWLGIMVEAPPLPIILYAHSERGFALCSMRSENLSRYYVQCPIEDTVDDWSDERFWEEFLARLPEEQRAKIVTGPSIEKSIAPIRSFVSEPMRYGSLMLVGDSAHIVPPTGAKGLNLAIADVRDTVRSLLAHYAGDDELLDGYSERALNRVWGAVRFSWSLTTMLHRFPDQTAFDHRVREDELHHLSTSEAARTDFAAQFVGLRD